MKILIVNNSKIPVNLYGGTERVIWSLGKELVKLGHEVVYLVQQGSYCHFAKVVFIDSSKPIVDQIPEDIDVIHFHFEPEGIERLRAPYVITFHGNRNSQDAFDRNTIFISKNHATRYGSTCFVHNGLDWNEYSTPDLNKARSHFHFLGKAAWRVKNLVGAIDIIKSIPSERLMVIGGVRFNFNMGIRLTWTPKVRFKGMLGGSEKDTLLNQSKGLVFPVRWHEPFGLAIIESLYFGCPVFGTPYGSLPEIVHQEVGFLSNKKNELKEALTHAHQFSAKTCHEYALSEFNSRKMALSYLACYEQVLSGLYLNEKQPGLIDVQTEKFLPWI